MLQMGFEPWLELADDGSVLVLPAVAPLSKLREGQRQLLEAAEASLRAAGGGGGGGDGAADAAGLEKSFRCRGCGQLVDQRRRHGPRTEMWQDEKVGGFRYRCLACPDYSLCESCYDSRHTEPGAGAVAGGGGGGGGGGAQHSEDHEFEIIGPEESHMKGAPAPPPIGGNHGRRGPWG
jgi:hypothetical protein